MAAMSAEYRSAVQSDTPDCKAQHLPRIMGMEEGVVNRPPWATPSDTFSRIRTGSVQVRNHSWTTASV